MSKEKHEAMLGMKIPTATHRLRMKLMHDMATRLGEGNCLRCGEQIETPEEISLDHRKPWRYVSAELFWDLDNLAFSHKKCNKRDRAFRIDVPEGTSWCGRCKKALPVEEFGKGPRWNGLNGDCLECNRERQRRYDKRNPRVPCSECGKPMRKKCRECGYEKPMAEYMALRRSEGVSY